MANIITNAYINDILDELVSLGTGGKLVVRLLQNSAVGNVGVNISTWSNLQAFEVAEGNGYTTGGVSLANVSKNNNKLTANNVQWPASTISARYGVVVDITNAEPEDQRVIMIIDFGSLLESTDGIFEIAWGSNGVLGLEI